MRSNFTRFADHICLIWFVVLAGYSFLFCIIIQVTIGFTEELNEKRPDDVDMQILRNVRRTAGHSRELMGELKSLKTKVYGLENELRHL